MHYSFTLYGGRNRRTLPNQQKFGLMLYSQYMPSRNLRTNFRPLKVSNQIAHGNEWRDYRTREPGDHEQWRRTFPVNKSGRRVCGIVEPSRWSTLLERNAAIRDSIVHHGLVMLLPGQWLEDIPITPVSLPQHLAATDIQRLELWNRILLNTISCSIQILRPFHGMPT